MPKSAHPQLNVRSAFARERVAALARQTGMTTTQVVEEALRAYVPPIEMTVNPNMIRSGKLLIRRTSGPTITLDQLNAEIEASRERSE